MTEKPRFRNDLVAQPIEEDGNRYVDVTDPNSGSTFRFYDVEYSIACAMDGARDLQGLAEWSRVELGVETSAEELSSVVSTLADLGYLEAGEAGAAGAAADAAPGPTNGEGAYAAETAAEVAAAYDQAMEPPAADAAGAGEPILAEEAGATEEPSAEFAQEFPTVPVGEAELKQAAEMSFAGMVEDEDATRKAIKAAPPAVSAHAPGSEEDEPTRIPAPAVEDDEEDEDVSVDLSAHLTLDKDEVVEAVRSSRVISVPEVPKGLTLDDEADQPPEAEGDAPAMPLPAPPVTQVGIDPTARKSATAASPEPGGAIKLPPVPPSAAGKAIEGAKAPAAATAAPAGARGTKAGSPALVIFVVVLLLAAGAVFFLRDKIFGKGEPAPQKPAKVDPKGKTPPPPQPPAAAPAAALELEGGTIEAAAPRDGSIEWVVAEGAKVAASDVIAKLDGYTLHEKAAARHKAEAERVKARLDFYTAEGNQAKITEKTDLLKKETDAVAESEKQMKAAVVTAPIAGTAQVLAKRGAKVKAGDPLVSIGGEPQLTATFDAGAAAAAYKAGGACQVAMKAARDKQFACVVDRVEGAKVSIRVVPGATAAAGDEVVLLPAK